MDALGVVDTIRMLRADEELMSRLSAGALAFCQETLVGTRMLRRLKGSTSKSPHPAKTAHAPSPIFLDSRQSGGNRRALFDAKQTPETATPPCAIIARAWITSLRSRLGRRPQECAASLGAKLFFNAVAPPARLLEIGGGEPIVSGLLNELGYDVTLVDPYDGSERTDGV